MSDVLGAKGEGARRASIKLPTSWQTGTKSELISSTPKFVNFGLQKNPRTVSLFVQSMSSRIVRFHQESGTSIEENSLHVEANDLEAF